MRGQFAETLDEAMRLLSKTSFDLILLDLVVPGVTGTEGLRQVLAVCFDTPVIIISGQGDVDIAVECIRAGAMDFIRKPFPPLETLVSRLQQALLCRAPSPGRICYPSMQRRGDMVFASAAMANVVADAERAAKTDLPVLILGETGTGKELIARRVHALGERHHAPFVPVNCGGLADSLVESELFGHAKGAFTGAFAARKGLFRAANNGTLFLDEVGELRRESQAKLLRALEDGEVRAVGESRTEHVDLRVVAASNRNLEQMLASGEFRADLFHRLAGRVVTIPPLRERPDDIGVLARHFLDEMGSTKQLLPQTLHALLRHAWPGNVRELRNAVRSAEAASRGSEIRARDLPMHPHPVASECDLSLLAYEEAALRRALESSGGNVSRAATTLGISRATFYRKMHRHAG
jgi:DNA-binding NtrC family response regulator